MKLLNIDNNAKTKKGKKKGYSTAILYLAPSKLSGYQVCPMATQGCLTACLNTAGQGAFRNVQDSRIKKTKFFFEHRETFMLQLEKELVSFVKKAEKDNMIPVVRLNGTSDIRWETISFIGADGKRYANMMERFPDRTFYDYTKLFNRKNLPPNYTLTFSLSEKNEDKAKQALKNKINVAVVFRKSFPIKYFGVKVINADEDDLRFLDEKPVICGLKAKGKAKKDTSNFVID